MTPNGRGQIDPSPEDRLMLAFSAIRGNEQDARQAPNREDRVAALEAIREAADHALAILTAPVCEECGRPMPPGARSHARYCGGACRTRASRRRRAVGR